MNGSMHAERSGPVVLASASASRISMLANVGLVFTAEASSVDEQSIKTALARTGVGAEQVAERLACEKAREVSRRHPGALVIGADQMLECHGEWLDKPPDMARALEQLRRLRGKSHFLVTSAVVVRDDAVLWRHDERAEMSMRDASDAFLESYLEAVGEEACRSVGAYQLEGRGAQLFDRVSGDFFVVLGLPLLPLLAFLRREGVLQE